MGKNKKDKKSRGGSSKGQPNLFQSLNVLSRLGLGGGGAEDGNDTSSSDSSSLPENKNKKFSNAAWVCSPAPRDRNVPHVQLVEALVYAKKKDRLEPSFFNQFEDTKDLAKIIFILARWMPQTRACSHLVSDANSLRFRLKRSCKVVGDGLHGLLLDGSNVDEKANEMGWQDEWWSPENYITAKAPHKGKRGLMAFSG